MSLRSVQCPGCQAVANVPAAMTSVRCPSCGTVWNVNNPAQATLSAAAKQASAQAAPPKVDDDESSVSNTVIIAGVLAGAFIFMVAIMGVAVVVLNRESPEPVAVEPEDTIKPLEPEEFRVVNLPEEQRKRIYDDYRKVARTTVEKPLALPQGTKIRKNLEVMLQKTYDRELNRFAALHDITVDDVQEVIKEGDAKNWDTSPRSHAVRDGKRVYAKEKSEGWEMNKNRKPI